MPQRPYAELPPAALSKGMLLVEENKVSKITDWEPILPGTRVVVDLRDQMTGEVSIRGLDWNKRVFATKGVSVELDGAHGKVGTLTVELAAMPDHDERLTYR